MVTTIREALEAIQTYLEAQSGITEKLMPAWENTNEAPAIILAPVGMTYTHDDLEVGRRPAPPWRAAEIEIQFRVAEGAIDGEKDALDMAARVEAALISDPTCGGRFEDYDPGGYDATARGAGVLLQRLDIRDDDELNLDENETAPEVALRVLARFGPPR